MTTVALRARDVVDAAHALGAGADPSSQGFFGQLAQQPASRRAAAVRFEVDRSQEVVGALCYVGAADLAHKVLFMIARALGASAVARFLAQLAVGDLRLEPLNAADLLRMSELVGT